MSSAPHPQTSSVRASAGPLTSPRAFPGAGCPGPVCAESPRPTGAPEGVAPWPAWQGWAARAWSRRGPVHGAAGGPLPWPPPLPLWVMPLLGRPSWGMARLRMSLTGPALSSSASGPILQFVTGAWSPPNRAPGHQHPDLCDTQVPGPPAWESEARVAGSLGSPSPQELWGHAHPSSPCWSDPRTCSASAFAFTAAPSVGGGSHARGAAEAQTQVTPLGAGVECTLRQRSPGSGPLAAPPESRGPCAPLTAPLSRRAPCCSSTPGGPPSRPCPARPSPAGASGECPAPPGTAPPAGAPRVQQD